MAIFFQTDGMTVDTYESMPQFLVYTGNEDADEDDGPDCVVPLTAENADDTLAFDTGGFFGSQTSGFLFGCYAGGFLGGKASGLFLRCFSSSFLSG